MRRVFLTIISVYHSSGMQDLVGMCDLAALIVRKKTISGMCIECSVVNQFSSTAHGHCSEFFKVKNGMRVQD